MIPPQLIQLGVNTLGTVLTQITGAIAAKRAERTAAAEEQARILEEVRKSQVAFNESVVGAFSVLWDEANAKMNQADKDFKAYVDKIRVDTAATAKADKFGGTVYGLITSISPVFEVAYSNKAGAERKQFNDSVVYKNAYKVVYPTLPANTSAQTDMIVVGEAQKFITKNAGTNVLYGSVPDKFNTTKGGTLATVNALLGRPEPSSGSPSSAVGPTGDTKSLTQSGGGGMNYLIIIGVIGIAAYFLFFKKKK